MFPEDNETGDPCEIDDEFLALLKSWERTQNGFDFHTLAHCVTLLVFHLRQRMDAIDSLMFLGGILQQAEYNLKASGYKVEMDGEGPMFFPGPELREVIEQQLGQAEVPDSVPDWLTELGEDEA